VERTFCRIKDWRRPATRCDNLARNFLAALAIASIASYWLRVSSLERFPTRSSRDLAIDGKRARTPAYSRLIDIKSESDVLRLAAPMRAVLGRESDGLKPLQRGIPPFTLARQAMRALTGCTTLDRRSSGRARDADQPA